MASASHPDQTDGKEGVSRNVCKLTEEGKYAFSGLAANILAELFYRPEEKEFRHKLLDDLMVSIELSEMARPSQIAVADGEYKTRPEPFLDLLLEQKVVKEDPNSLLTSLLLVAIKDGVYDARVRVVVEHMSWMLRVDMKSVEFIEDHLIELLRNHGEPTEEEKKAMAVKSRNKKIKRGFLIGLATVVGGTVIGLTGGLAAPLIATGVGAIIGTAGGAALGSVAGVAIIGSLFGVAGAGLTGYKMKKRVGGVEQFEFDVLSEGSQMTLTVAISGWVSKKGNEDFRTPWLALDNSKEQYFLKYEGHYLQELGQSLDTLSSLVMKQAIAETLKYTALSTLLAAIAWPSALLGLASVIDNPWHVCTKRAENAGKHLAEVLVTRQQGQRPVTLIGFSLGARVIFYCLKELAAHPRGAGIVESAYLLGAPVPGNPEEWRPFSKVVAGRIVNAYIRNDWMLKFLYRTASVQFKIAGISPVMWDDRRMINMDLTNVVNGHMDYMKKMPTVLEAVGIRTKDVHNVFMSHSDSGYSTQTTNSCVNDDCTALIPKRHSAESLEMAEEPPILNIGAHISPDENVEEITDKSQNKPAYSKLDAHKNVVGSDVKAVTHTAKSQLTGETTDSDRSLTDKLHYNQLVEQDSIEGGLTRSMSSPKNPRTKTVVIPVTKAPASERLLGDTDCHRLVESSDSPADTSSNESVLSHKAKPASGQTCTEENTQTTQASANDSGCSSEGPEKMDKCDNENLTKNTQNGELLNDSELNHESIDLENVNLGHQSASDEKRNEPLSSCDENGADIKIQCTEVDEPVTEIGSGIKAIGINSHSKTRGERDISDDANSDDERA